ncbi:MAG TPA: hypothetical protein PK362_01850 [Elusimicrobiota bacterium]|nr:hypothetical protein [Elusimicrobiota bacterium]
MLVVAIIGLLAAIAIPKFANLVVKAKEASVRGKSVRFVAPCPFTTRTAMEIDFIRLVPISSTL